MESTKNDAITNNKSNEKNTISNSKKLVKCVLNKSYDDTSGLLEIGIDEVGRGPLFGRVYAAAVVLPKDDAFDHSRMKDSKKFHSKKKIDEASQYIKENALAWYISFEDEKKIDDINILQATQLSMHNSVFEIRKQLKEKTGAELPTHVVACVGGGSNAAGAFYHFLNEPTVDLVAVEAAGHGVYSGMSAATTQLGTTGILHGSKSILMQTKDGQVVEPHSISAGLDYPGIGPLHAYLFKSGRGTFTSATDEEALEWASHLSKIEGIIPALETAHAFAILPKMNFKPTDIVVVCLSGRGDKDLATYMSNIKM